MHSKAETAATVARVITIVAMNEPCGEFTSIGELYPNYWSHQAE